MPEGCSVFVTIGHSNRTLDDFVTLLREAAVTALVDVRKLRGSRAYPHFNEEVLREALPDRGISYVVCEPLAGRRPRSKDVPPETNGVWRNQSFHNYADHALSDEFSEGLDDLVHLGETREPAAVAIMCAEAVWWRCHRRIIADHLLAHGETVTHVLSSGQHTPAELTEGAEVADDGVVTYPLRAA